MRFQLPAITTGESLPPGNITIRMKRVLIAYVPERGIRTIYVAIGDSFVFLCAVILFGVIVFSFVHISILSGSPHPLPLLPGGEGR